MIYNPWLQPLPPSLTLIGEKRFKDPLTNPAQCWIVSGGKSSSLSLGIRSDLAPVPGTINLTARYEEKSKGSAVPEDFPQPPLLELMSWDWVSYRYHPLQELEVEVINWVPDPRVICGMHQIQNLGPQHREVSLKLTCLDEMGLLGIHFKRETIQGRSILSGESPDHSLVLFLSDSGSDTSGPTNRLSASVALEPKGKSVIRWILVCCDSGAEAHTYLEEVIKLDWAGEISHRKVSLGNQLQLKMGQPEWDFSLAYSQRQAQVILRQLSLQVDQRGHSRPALNSRQTWHLLQAVGPLDAKTHASLLQNSFQDEPGQNPDFPIHAELLWQALEAGISPDLALELLPIAENRLSCWFSEANDKDGDNIPENPAEDIFQLEPRTAPDGASLDCWQAGAWLESPALAALLLHELDRVNAIQEMIARAPSPDPCNDLRKDLSAFILASWHDNEGRFRTRDYQTHTSGERYKLPDPLQNGWNPLHRELPYPFRLVLSIPGSSSADHNQELQITLQGFDWLDRYRIEEFNNQDLYWHGNGCWGITRSVFKSLDYCVIQGLKLGQEAQIQTLESDSPDLSLTLPLWWGDLPPEIGLRISTSCLTDPERFWSEHGLKTHLSYKNGIVQLPLNLLVSAGLIKNGQAKLAADLFKRWMETISDNLQRSGYLYAAWDAKTGRGLGMGNEIESLVPVGILLELLGVHFLLSGELVLEPKPPLLFPVDLYFRGTEIRIRENETIIRRRGGTAVPYDRREKMLLQL